MKSLIVALLLTAAACQPKPELVVSAPPVVDLSCPAEPDVAAMLAADPSGVTFDAAVRSAGEACRQALARVCRWHKERGAVVSCPEALRP